MFGVDAGEVQMSESTTKEHLGTKALLKIWDELPQDAVKKSITSFCKHLRASIQSSKLAVDTLNIHCNGRPLNQWYFLHVNTGVFFCISYVS